MARVHINSNGVLLLDTEENGVALSIKPTSDKLRFWGNVGAFNYSILASKVTSVLIVRNKATDKVWIDKTVTLPISYLDRVVPSDFVTAVQQIDQRVKP